MGVLFLYFLSPPALPTREEMSCDEDETIVFLAWMTGGGWLTSVLSPQVPVFHSHYAGFHHKEACHAKHN